MKKVQIYYELLISYFKDTCKQDPDFQSYGTKFKESTESVFSSPEGFSIGCVETLISSISDWSKMTANIILECEDEIWQWMAENDECLDLVKKYFNNSAETLAFCSELDKFLLSARACHSYMQHKIEPLESEINNNGVTDDNYSRILVSLKNITSSDRVSNVIAAAKGLHNEIGCLRDKHEKMLDDLKLHKETLAKKLKKNRTWRKIINSIFISTLVCLVVCSVVGTLACMPHLAPVVGLATWAHAHPVATSVTCGLLHSGIVPTAAGLHWVDSMLKNYENIIVKQMGLIESMKVGTVASIKELDEIKLGIQKLENGIVELARSGNFSAKDDVGFAIDEIKNSVREFGEKINQLSKKATEFSSEILEARNNVLQRTCKLLEIWNA